MKSHIEVAAIKAFEELEENDEYDFETSELAGYWNNCVVLRLYEQAFFAGYNYAKSLETKND